MSASERLRALAAMPPDMNSGPVDWNAEALGVEMRETLLPLIADVVEAAEIEHDEVCGCDSPGEIGVCWGDGRSEESVLRWHALTALREHLEGGER